LKKFVRSAAGFAIAAAMVLAAALAQDDGFDKKKLVTKNAQSPGAETAATIAGKQLWIYYHAPSVRGRKIFGGADALQPDDSIWRLGADYATVLHTSGELQFRGLTVPAGNYSLYIFLDRGNWQLIFNKKTGQWGVDDNDHTSDTPADELGRVPMTMRRASQPAEQLRIALAPGAANRGTLTVTWENVVAEAQFSVK
jgi:hypothetical protein